MRSARTALTTTFQNPGNVEVIDIDDCTENYGGREEIDDHNMDFDDVTGDVYACCPAGDGGCLTLTEGCVSRCVRCKQVVAR